MRRIKDNTQVLSKAAITSGSFTSQIGLSEQEADAFIDFVIDESGLKDRVRLVRMNKRSVKIDKLLLANERVLKPGVSAVDPGETVAITTEQILLESKEIVAVVRIGDDALEDNIEGDAFADHLLGMIARASANQLEDALLYGRKLPSGTPTNITQLWDGWITQVEAGGNLVDANGAGFGDRFMEREKLSKLLKALPTKFRKDKRSMNFTMADDIDQDWADVVLSGRATMLGDNALQGDLPNRYRGVNFAPSGLIRTDRPLLVSGGGSTTLDNSEAAGSTVLEVPSTTNLANGEFIVIARGTAKEEVRQILSFVADISITVTEETEFQHDSGVTVEEVTADATDVLLGNYKNLILGIQREMTVEPDRLPRLRATDWVISMRVIPEVEEVTALALLQNLKVK